MINDDLIAKMNNLEELPVSEEMLGAYLENNLSNDEASQVESLLLENDSLSGFMDDIMSSLNNEDILGFQDLNVDGNGFINSEFGLLGGQNIGGDNEIMGGHDLFDFFSEIDLPEVNNIMNDIDSSLPGTPDIDNLSDFMNF